MLIFKFWWTLKESIELQHAANVQPAGEGEITILRFLLMTFIRIEFLCSLCRSSSHKCSLTLWVFVTICERTVNWSKGSRGDEVEGSLVSWRRKCNHIIDTGRNGSIMGERSIKNEVVDLENETNRRNMKRLRLSNRLSNENVQWKICLIFHHCKRFHA